MAYSNFGWQNAAARMRGAMKMTGKTFRGHVYLTIVALLAASVLSLWAGTENPSYADESRSILTVYIAVAAAWLTYCLQRRVAYINALRAFWERLVKTVQCAVKYTSDSGWSEADFKEVKFEFKCRIDEMRGIFRNIAERYERPTNTEKRFVVAVKHARTVDELDALVRGYPVSSDRKGLYPYESLKQMLGVVEKLGHGTQVGQARANTACDTLMLLWGILRAELLKELDRDFPEFPDTPYTQRSRFGGIRAGWNYRIRSQLSERMARTPPNR